jgi:hypothetical protein
MTNDRNYLRMLSDSGLIDAARYCDNDLALVLGERLEAALAALKQSDAYNKRAGRIRRPVRYLEATSNRSNGRSRRPTRRQMTALLAGAALFLLTLLLDD